MESVSYTHLDVYKRQEEQVVFAEFVTSSLVNAQIPFAVNSDTKFYDRETNNWIDNMLPVFNTIFK